MKVLCLLGPTASGKTSLAIKLASVANIEIISVDSAMIYKGLDIGTGKPDEITLSKTPHRLVDFLDPADSYSVGDFINDVEANIKEIHANGNIPLLVGGTMMYFNALYNGIGDMPVSDPEIRENLENKLKNSSLENLYNELKQIDPISAEKININDTQRILRALEVYYISGKPISSFIVNNNSILKDYEVVNIVIAPDSRAKVHENIAVRFDEMLDLGFIKEVENLCKGQDLSLNNSSIRSVGYKQLWQFLNSEMSFDEMKEQAVAATRQLAKRQFTWLRKLEKQVKFNWLNSYDSDILQKALKIYKM